MIESSNKTYEFVAPDSIEIVALGVDSFDGGEPANADVNNDQTMVEAQPSGEIGLMYFAKLVQARHDAENAAIIARMNI